MTPEPQGSWLFRVCGGRKNFNGYLVYVTLVVLAFFLPGATYESVALWVTVALGVNHTATVVEDRAKHMGQQRDTAPLVSLKRTGRTDDRYNDDER